MIGRISVINRRKQKKTRRKSTSLFTLVAIILFAVGQELKSFG